LSKGTPRTDKNSALEEMYNNLHADKITTVNIMAQRTIYDKELTLLYTNANSLHGKIVELRSRVEQDNIDIIGKVESFERSEITDSELYMSGYQMFRADRKTGKKGGGLIIYVKDTLSATLVDNLGTEFQESLWCVVKLKGNKISYWTMSPKSK
jgi:hypothetical protein